jgi:CheY-like chemotaxis protein
MGFTVVEASDGSVALDLIRANRDCIDVVLLDATLPGIPSREVFEETQRVRPDLKVVLTSAYRKETVDVSFAGLQVEHFIRKPFQLDDLPARGAGILTGGRSIVFPTMVRASKIAHDIGTAAQPFSLDACGNAIGAIVGIVTSQARPAMARTCWLEQRQAELLPVTDFHVVFAQPGHDRPIGASEPEQI